MKKELYKINGKQYNLKEKYSLKDWGEIIKIISGMDFENQMSAMVFLFTDDKLIRLLNILLDDKVEGEIYEDDFEAVSKAVNDFFSRKKNLMKNMARQ